MKSISRLWVYALLLIGIPSVIAQENCTALLETILNDVDSACARVNVDTVCYGSGSIDLTSRSDDATLVNSGDSLALTDVEAIQVSGDNETDYGMLAMTLQANNPSETAPTTVYALGDVSITNDIPVFLTVSVTTTANARTRRIPQVDENPGNIITAIPQGVVLSAIGRTEDGTWLYLELDRFADKGATEGWVSTQVLSVNGDQMVLPVVDLENPIEIISPMSSLTLDTVLDSSDCDGLPPSGIIIQSPNGDTATLSINGVEIQVVGTVFIDTDAEILNLYVVEGRGVIIGDEQPEFVPAGTKTVVTINGDNQMIASAPLPYDADYLAPLDSLLAGDMMVQSTSSGVLQVAEIAAPLPEEEVEVAVQETFAPFGGIDGIYRVVGSSGGVDVTFTEDAIIWGDPTAPGTLYTLGGDGNYYGGWTLSYDSAGTADGRTLQTTSVNNYTIIITSPTTFTLEQEGTITRPIYPVEGQPATDVETSPTSRTDYYVWVSF